MAKKDMYDLIRLYAMPIAFAILTVMDWMEGDDFLTACFVWGNIHFFVQLVLVMARDRYAEWCDGRRRERIAREHDEEAFRRATRHRDITLDDLNALLERIDRGEDDVPDTPLLTTNEMRCQRTYSYATLYSDNVAYTTITEVPTPYGTVERA